MNHDKYMLQALELAALGVGHVNPNPLVGCVIVKDDKVIATGYHAKYGDYHAERNAILNSKENLSGSTLYVNLEPCCHHGKTPPCTDLIIEHKIKTVVVGVVDPNPLVAGKGIAQLEAAGIEVIVNVLKAECEALNSIHMFFVQHKKPYVLYKYAMTLDGKSATATDDSKWVSNASSRAHVQLTRKQYSAIMVGVNTVLKDDPLLTCRIDPACNPIRIVCDTHLKTPLNSQLVNTAKQVRTIIATNVDLQEKLLPFKQAGCEILTIKLNGKELDLEALMHALYALNIDSVLLEGGPTLAGSMISANCVQKIHTYISPKLIGDNNALSPLGGLNIKQMKAALKLSLISIKHFDEDILIETELR